MDKFWMGIGFLCADLKFFVSVQKSVSTKSGFRLNRFIIWRSGFQYIKQQQSAEKIRFSFLKPLLEKFDLPFQQRYNRQEDIEKWMTFIEHLGLEEYLSDEDGFKTMKWILENPIPSNFEAFVKWAEEFEGFP